MKLEQFREIADENLQDFVVDERMLQRVHQKIYEEKAARRPAIPRRAISFAAACVALMVVSGGVLLGTMSTGKRDPALALQMSKQEGPLQPINSASTALAAHMQTSAYVDGSVLSYGIEQIGEYKNGYAVALATNGFYGIVNEERIWVVKAVYDEAEIQSEEKAVVLFQGTEQIIEIPAK